LRHYISGGKYEKEIDQSFHLDSIDHDIASLQFAVAGIANTRIWRENTWNAS
jgi:hypothetical protein